MCIGKRDKGEGKNFYCLHSCKTQCTNVDILRVQNTSNQYFVKGGWAELLSAMQLHFPAQTRLFTD